MSFQRNYSTCGGGGGAFYDNHWPSFHGHYFSGRSKNMDLQKNDGYRNWNYYRFPDYSNFHEVKSRENMSSDGNYANSHNVLPSFKRRKFSASTWGEGEGQQLPLHNLYHAVPSRSNAEVSSSAGSKPDKIFCASTWGDGINQQLPLHNMCQAVPSRPIAEVSTSSGCKRDRSLFEDNETMLMSRYEIERYSPSRKDGIDLKHEIHLRYSYCAFLQNLGMRLNLPQTTIGTAMVLCHRFFVRRSHACNDRFLIATATLFLAAKSEETARPLNDVLRASSEILHKQNFAVLSFHLSVGWFERYRERVIEAEQMILTTLNFELNVQHPYASLTSVLNKLGLSQTMLVNLALNLVSEGVYYTRLALLALYFS